MVLQTFDSLTDTWKDGDGDSDEYEMVKAKE